MSYPRYKREEKACSKLSVAEVRKLNKLREDYKYSFTYLGKIFGISRQHAWVLCQSEEKRIEIVSRWKRYKQSYNPIRSKKAKDRKKKLKEKEILVYREETNKRRKIENELRGLPIK